MTNSSVERKIMFGFALALLILCAICIVSYRSTAQLAADAASVKQSQEVLTRLAAMLSTMTDVETGQRGYTITGDQSFLEPYRQAVVRLDEQFRRLRELTAEKPRQLQRLNALEPLIASRMAFARTVIELRRTLGFEAARKETVAGKGKQLHDRIRKLVAEMEQENIVLLTRQEVKSLETARFVRGVIVVGSLLAIALTALAFAALHREFAARSRMESTVKIAQQQLLNIIDFLPDATFVIDRDKRVIAWNRACETMTGVKKETVLGRGDYAYAEPFFGSRRPILIDLLDQTSSQEEAKYKYIKRIGNTVTAESFIPHLRDGQGAHLWGTASPLFDQEGRRCGAIEVIRDVTEQKHVEQALRESELKHRTLFETANDAIMLMRTDRFIDCNARTLTMFGCRRDEIVGAPPYEYSPPLQPDGRRSQEAALERINKAFTEGPQFFEWLHCRRDGTPFMAEVSLNRLQLGGETFLQAIVRDIAERKRAEEALRQSEATLRSVFLAAPVGITIMQDRVIKSVNRFWIEMFGYPEESVIGKTSRMFYQNDEEYERVGRELYDNLQERGLASVETRLRCHDGSFRDAIVTTAPIRQDNPSAGTVAIIHDITERKKAEEALQENERKYRELVEYANSIILRWTHDGRITFLNEFGQRFFGYTAKEIVGRHVIGTIVPEKGTNGRDLHRLIDQICADPAAFEQNVNENMRRNGERVWIAWTNKIVRGAQGQIEQILSVGTDITKLKKAEEAIRELNIGLEKRVAERTAELAVAKDRAEAADRLKSTFLATMSHELRTPLNSIIGFTGIILQELAGPLNAEQRKQLEMVRDSSRHLLELINDVLDISKIEAGQLEVRSEPFDLRASITKVAGIVKPLAEKNGLALRVELAPEVGMLVSDPRRVEQVLLNLLNNAIKFTERGEVTLTAETVPGALRIAVADTGIGIKPEDLGTLFQPFRQIDMGLTRQREGTGLGLAICRRLADLLGGEIRAASEWGKGSVFTITLPAKGQGTK